MLNGVDHCLHPIPLSSAEATRGWGRWIEEKRRCAWDDGKTLSPASKLPTRPRSTQGSAKEASVEERDPISFLGSEYLGQAGWASPVNLFTRQTGHLGLSLETGIAETGILASQAGPVLM